MSLLCATSLSGCLDSPVLVTRVLDPSSSNIDYENPLKNYVEDPNAEQTADDIAATSNATADDIEKTIQDEAIYDTKDTSTDEAAESGKVSKGSNSSTTASKEKSSNKGKKKQSSNNNSAKKDNGGKGGKNQGKDDASGDGDKDATANDPGNVYNGNGKLENLPTDIESVCAVGEAATMVLSIAGSDYLAGSSKDYLHNSSVKKLFTSDALAKVKTCWKGDGTNSSDIDTSAIIKLKPDAVLAISGQDTVSSSAQKKLREAGISVITLPSMASDSYIKKAVRAVGYIFQEATDGASATKASDYASMVDDVLKAAKDSHGGTVSTYNNVDYDNVTDANPTNSSAGGASNWTVLVTGWESKATVSASFNGKTLFKDSGVATCKIGWKWSPVSYYLGCGGAVNNAAAYGSYSSASVSLFLNYNENQVKYSWSGLSKEVTVGKDGGTFKQGNTHLLTNACSARDSEQEHHLGSSDFNKIIVTTKNIKTKLNKARSKSLGLYTPGSYQTNTSVSGYGLNINGQLLRCYSVTNDASRGDSLYSILVNPSGLMGSWTKGSMESFLEAAWAASEFSGYSKDKLKSAVKEFYSEFYGYSLSDDEYNKIINGDYTED